MQDKPPTVEYQVRKARVADLPAIVEIYNQSISGRRATADTQPVTVEQREAWFAAHHPATHPLFVADARGEIWGWQSFERFYGRPAYAATAEISLYVAGPRQRRGVGSRLLAHALDQCPRLGLERLLAFVFAHNEPSIKLFTRHGFERWGLLPGVARMDDSRLDLLILGRSA